MPRFLYGFTCNKPWSFGISSMHSSKWPRQVQNLWLLPYSREMLAQTLFIQTYQASKGQQGWFCFSGCATKIKLILAAHKSSSSSVWPWWNCNICAHLPRHETSQLCSCASSGRNISVWCISKNFARALDCSCGAFYGLLDALYSFIYYSLFKHIFIIPNKLRNAIHTCDVAGKASDRSHGGPFGLHDQY